MSSNSSSSSRSQRRSREETEKLMLDTAMAVIERDGVLAGLNLAEVSESAGVNRGLIYTYFGSRQGLLRSAISRTGWEGLGTDRFIRRFGHLPFVERRLAVFRDSLFESDRARLLALLVLDNDPDARIFPSIETAREHLTRDVAAGDLPPDSDPLVAHAMTAALYLGYGLFRKHMADELDIDLEELDERATAVVERMTRGITQAP